MSNSKSNFASANKSFSNRIDFAREFELKQSQNKAPYMNSNKRDSEVEVMELPLDVSIINSDIQMKEVDQHISSSDTNNILAGREIKKREETPDAKSSKRARENTNIMTDSKSILMNVILVIIFSELRLPLPKILIFLKKTLLKKII